MQKIEVWTKKHYLSLYSSKSPARSPTIHEECHEQTAQQNHQTLAAAFVSVLVTITLSIVRRSGFKVWASARSGRPAPSGPHHLFREWSLPAQDDDSGNMVLRYNDGKIIGDTATCDHPGTVAFMRDSGAQILRAPGNVPIWESRTAGHPGTVIQIQNGRQASALCT
ncbi:hypothetical protein IPG36_06595 [bacterium]|nr:MAG: hypothetical protein IPG36_06595 [bacterium]